MNCAVCKHDWCWTCGMSKKSWFHRMQIKTYETGLLCEFVNSINVSSVTKIILCIFALTISPPFIMIAGTLFGPAALVKYMYTESVKTLSDYTFRKTYTRRLVAAFILGVIFYLPLIPLFAVSMIFVVIYC